MIGALLVATVCLCEEGSMMSALFCQSSHVATRLVDGPDDSKLVMTMPLKKEDAGRLVLGAFAGADWTEAGRFTTAEEWHDYVKKGKEKTRQ